MIRSPLRTNETQIQVNPKNRLDLDSNENCDPLLIKKQEPWYKDDSTINYGLSIDKSG